MSAVVVGELLYGFRQGTATSSRGPRGAAVLSRQAIRVVRTRRSGDRGPLLQDHGISEGEGKANPDQRRVGRGTRDGDRSGPGFS